MGTKVHEEAGMRHAVVDPGPPQPTPPGGILRTTFRVGYRFRCTMTMDVSRLVTGPAIGILNAQWEPSPPKRLSATELRDYRAGRNGLIRLVANNLGRRIGVGELAEDASTNGQPAHSGGCCLVIER
jgi:hypothetical protein